MVDIFTWLDYLPRFLKPWEQDARERFKRDLEWCMERLEVGLTTPVRYLTASKSRYAENQRSQFRWESHARHFSSLRSSSVR